MGGQGILLRKVTLDKTLYQLNYFLKGALVILVLYMVNGLVIEKNLQARDLQILAGLYLILFLGFYFLKKKKEKLQENEVMQDLRSYFGIEKISEVAKLDKRLIDEIKNNRQFITYNGQIVGTDHYLLLDFSDGQFMLFPIQQIQSLHLDKVGMNFCVKLKTAIKTEEIFFKKKKDALEFIDFYHNKY